jgi:hypothetical protein
MTTISLQLKKAIAESGQSLYRIAKDSNVDYAVLHNFFHGKRDIQLVSANKLAEYFELDLTPRSRGGKKRKK